MSTHKKPSAQDKLSELTEAIVKAVPEIIEVKFGCIAEWEGERMMVLEEGPKRAHLSGMFQLTSVEGNGVVVGDLEDENGKILGCGVPVYVDREWEKVLGRPITLEDVAITIREIGTSDLHDCPRGGRSVGETLWDIWHLGKPLSQQPPETIDFLHSILLP